MPGAYSKAEMLEKCRMMDLNGDVDEGQNTLVIPLNREKILLI